jgi:pimeloyl-ACP methyl ester carboxylesterase
MTSMAGLRFFGTGEVAIHYSEWTAESASLSTTYLFIHGITGRHETWLEVIDESRGGARAIAVDLRGHGRSGHAFGAYRLSDYTRDITTLIDERKLGPAIIVGHSLGAVTGLQLAATRPELVSALVLEDPPLFARHIMENVFPERHASFGQSGKLSGSGRSVAKMAEELRAANPDAADEVAQKRALSLFMTDANAIMHVHDERLDWAAEIESILRSVQCPVLLLQGKLELGGWMRNEDGVRAQALIPNCELAVWDDTGHNLHSAHPEMFIEQTNDFVTRLRSK